MTTVSKIIIEPGKTEKNYWSDLWRFRELFYILSWRDIKVRYKQTVLGVAWALIRPLLTTVVFTVVFNKLAGLSSGNNVPYPIMVYCGMLPWTFFATSLTESSNSLIGNANLITKVYFPRMIIPASSVITSFVDFGISFLILICMFFWYGYMPDVNIFLLPLFILLTFFAAFGTGLLITAVNVKYRDFRYIIPFIIQFGLYVTPVGFSSSIIPEQYKLLYALNPMVGIIDGFRWCITGAGQFNWQSFSLSVVVILVFLFWGIRYFRKMETTFADRI